MCNIAGYIGKKQAAPILLAMMAREEGYAGGYYTGITVHNGAELVSHKAVGPLSSLLKAHDCAAMEGTVGFIHSRSRSGGGYEWGQPFVSEDGASSLIANGAAGVFLTEEMARARCDIAMRLDALGYRFRSRTEGVVGKYPALADGTAIHSTDLMCQYVTHLIDGGMAADEAMSAMMGTLPCEAVVLLMRRELPDTVLISRINYPMTVGIAEDGDLYFATTRLAFPTDVAFREIYLLPAMATYELSRTGVRRSAHPIPLDVRVTEITPALVDAAYPRFLRRLEEAARPLQGWEIIEAYADLWREGEIPQAEPMLYFMVERLAAEGRLALTPLSLPGAIEGATGLKFGISVKK